MTIAPMWRRVAAGMIDFVVAATGLAALVGAIVAGLQAGVFRRLERLRILTGSADRSNDHMSARAADMRLSSTTLWALNGFGLVTTVLTRNVRSPGYHAMGLRRVELPTARRISLRAALIRYAVYTLRSRLMQQLFRPDRGVQGDRRGSGDASDFRLRSTRKRTVLRVLTIAALDGPGLANENHQSFADRLARIAVIHDR